MSERRPRRPQPEQRTRWPRVLAAFIAAGGLVTLLASLHKGESAESDTAAKVDMDTGAEKRRKKTRHTELSRSAQDDPDLSAEDKERAREHEEFKLQAADALLEALGGKYNVGWMITEPVPAGEPTGPGIYDEFITIRGDQGEDLGSVYPDEETGDLTFFPRESTSQWINDKFNSPLEPLTSTDAADIPDLVETSEEIEYWREQWDAAQTHEERREAIGNVAALLFESDLTTFAVNQYRLEAEADTGIF